MSDPATRRNNDSPAATAVADARAAEKLGDWEKAREAMTRASEADPRDALSHALMGWFTSRCASVSDAERERLSNHHLDYAVELDPNDGEVRYLYGRVFANRMNL